jgi:hypothetical protein
MTEKHALRQGYKDLIEYYDSEKAQAPEEVAPKEQEPAKEEQEPAKLEKPPELAPTPGLKVNLS